MEIKIPNDSRLLREVSKDLIKSLKERNVPEDVIFNVHVAFEEALRNAMIHGNRMDPGKKVLVETKLTENDITICVEDEGQGFDPDNLPDPTVDDNILKESGRGVYMMRHLMDTVEYMDGGRKVVMARSIRPKSQN